MKTTSAVKKRMKNGTLDIMFKEGGTSKKANNETEGVSEVIHKKTNLEKIIQGLRKDKKSSKANNKKSTKGTPQSNVKTPKQKQTGKKTTAEKKKRGASPPWKTTEQCVKRLLDDMLDQIAQQDNIKTGKKSDKGTEKKQKTLDNVKSKKKSGKNVEKKQKQKKVGSSKAKKGQKTVDEFLKKGSKTKQSTAEVKQNKKDKTSEKKVKNVTASVKKVNVTAKKMFAKGKPKNKQTRQGNNKERKIVKELLESMVVKICKRSAKCKANQVKKNSKLPQKRKVTETKSKSSNPKVSSSVKIIKTRKVPEAERVVTVILKDIIKKSCIKRAQKKTNKEENKAQQVKTPKLSKISKVEEPVHVGGELRDTKKNNRSNVKGAKNIEKVVSKLLESMVKKVDEKNEKDKKKATKVAQRNQSVKVNKKVKNDTNSFKTNGNSSKIKSPCQSPSIRLKVGKKKGINFNPINNKTQCTFDVMHVNQSGGTVQNITVMRSPKASPKPNQIIFFPKTPPSVSAAALRKEAPKRIMMIPRKRKSSTNTLHQYMSSHAGPVLPMKPGHTGPSVIPVVALKKIDAGNSISQNPPQMMGLQYLKPIVP